MRVILASSVLLVVGGCYNPPTGFDSPVPALRLQAITDAARTNDRSAIPDLISMLQSDDPVIRMTSIRTLERLTGTTLGYDYAAPEWQRRDQIQAWADWYRQHQSEIPPPNQGGRAENSPSRGQNQPISGTDA